MSEKRVMSSPGGTRPGGGSGGGKGDGEGGEDGAAKKGGRKKLLLVVAVVLVAAAAAWFFLLKPAPAEAEAEPEPVAGEVAALEPVTINLADGRYLKLGLALQLTAEVEEEVSGSKALDAAISLYSGRTIDELSDPVHREELKEELTLTLEEEYHGEVMDVYLTEYVMQ